MPVQAIIAGVRLCKDILTEVIVQMGQMKVQIGIPADGCLMNSVCHIHTHILETVRLSHTPGSALSSDPQGQMSCSLLMLLTVAFPPPAVQEKSDSRSGTVTVIRSVSLLLPFYMGLGNLDN